MARIRIGYDKNKKRSLAVLLLLGPVSLLMPAIADARAATVPIEAAKTAAAQKLPLFYNGDWDYFTHFVLYDLEGQAAAYAVVFTKVGERVQPLPAIRESMAAGRGRIAALAGLIDEISADDSKPGKQKNEQIAELREQMRAVSASIDGLDVFATVVSGATEDRPIVLKCHRGLPTAFVQESDALDLLQSSHPGMAWDIQRYLYLGPFDTVFEAIPSVQAGSQIDEADALQSTVVELTTGSVQPLDDLRLAHEQRMTERLTRQDEAAAAELEARKDQNKRAWQKYMRRPSELTKTEATARNGPTPSEAHSDKPAPGSPATPKAPMESTKREVLPAGGGQAPPPPEKAPEERGD